MKRFVAYHLLMVISIPISIQWANFAMAEGNARDVRPSDSVVSTISPAAASSWNLTFAKGPQGENNAAILHTADIDRSDPLFAGLMLRCADRGLDVVAVVLKPFPPKTHPHVTLRNNIQTSFFDGTVIPTGAGILLPMQGVELLDHGWLSNPDLTIKIADGADTIEGVVQLAGLSEAATRLINQCSKK